MARKWFDGGMVCQISVNNPEAFNALSSEIIQELVSDFGAVIPVSHLRVIIFRGAPAGKYKSPLAGADLSQLVKETPGESGSKWEAISAASAQEHMEEGIKAIEKIRMLCRNEGLEHESNRVVIPVVGMVDGPCLAGGVEFMFGLSDYVLATTQSFFGMREIRLGGMGGWRGPQTLKEIFGNHLWLKEMLLGLGDGNKFGDISAETALARGLVNRLVEPADIENETAKLVERIVSLDPNAVSCNLVIANMPVTHDCTSNVTCFMTKLIRYPAWVEGVRAFYEKTRAGK